MIFLNFLFFFIFSIFQFKEVNHNMIMMLHILLQNYVHDEDEGLSRSYMSVLMKDCNSPCFPPLRCLCLRVLGTTFFQIFFFFGSYDFFICLYLLFLYFFFSFYFLFRYLILNYMKNVEKNKSFF